MVVVSPPSSITFTSALVRICEDVASCPHCLSLNDEQSFSNESLCLRLFCQFSVTKDIVCRDA